MSDIASEKWRSRQPLTGTDLTDFLALRRVCEHSDSRVDKLGDGYVENERPLLPFIADGLTVLIDAGHVTLASPEPAAGGRQRILVTAIGRARYEQLCDWQGIAPYPGGTHEGTSNQ